MLHIYGIYGSFFSWVDRPTSASFCTSPIQRDHMYVWRYGDDLQMGERFPTRRGEARAGDRGWHASMASILRRSTNRATALGISSVVCLELASLRDWFTVL